VKEIRCPACKALLMKGQVVEVEVKCRKCGKMVRIREGARFPKIDS
jgi:phage FluMu protein Com